MGNKGKENLFYALNHENLFPVYLQFIESKAGRLEHHVDTEFVILLIVTMEVIGVRAW